MNAILGNSRAEIFNHVNMRILVIRRKNTSDIHGSAQDRSVKVTLIEWAPIAKPLARRICMMRCQKCGQPAGKCGSLYRRCGHSRPVANAAHGLKHRLPVQGGRYANLAGPAASSVTPGAVTTDSHLPA